MSDKVCALPFLHFCAMPDGDIHPCCVSPEPVQDSSGRTLNIKTDRLTEIWNSDAMRSIRAAMLRGDEPAVCKGCYETERRGFASARNNYNQMIFADENTGTFTGFSHIDRATLTEVAPPPTYFDMRFDNVCNLKCVMCFASESSSIENDPVHIAWTGEQRLNRSNRFGGPKKWVASDELFEEVKEIGQNVEYIRFAGGEPFRSALALRWLEWLGNNGKAANVTLQFYTNLQLFNERIVTLLEPFKYISFVLSIDGVGETYEYVRYPGKWKTVEDNCRRLAQERKPGGRLMRSGVSINTTMSFASAPKIIEVFEFCRSLMFGCTLGNARDPAHASTMYLPEASKRRLEAALREYAARTPWYTNLPGEIDRVMTDVYASSPATLGHNEAMLNCMRFHNDMDVSRNLDLKRIQPELVIDFVEQLGSWDDSKLHSQPIRQGALNIETVTLNDTPVAIKRISGGSIESYSVEINGYKIYGWALDTGKKEPIQRVVAFVGDDLVATTTPQVPRKDINAGFGVALAGFSIIVPRVGNRPTIDEPIRLFSITSDTALPIACQLVGPLARVPFHTTPMGEGPVSHYFNWAKTLYQAWRTAKSRQ